MSNIYLEVTFEEKNWRSQNFDFLGVKNLSTGQFWGSPTDESIIKFWNFLLQLIKQKYGNKTMSDFSIISFFKGINYNFLKSERTCILLNKNINFNKSKTDSKMENRTHTFRETKLALQVISQLRIKSNTVMSWSSQKKKEDIFCTVYFVRRNFF